MSQKKNEQFIILSGIGILIVMLGHLNWQILSFAGKMPYYSYQVMIFVFISGYFYKTEEEKNIFSYVKRKFFHLMLPYFIWNFFYGTITYFIHHFDSTEIYIGEEPSLYNFTLAPFISGHQFMFNAASWFVPALFLLQLCNILGRKILSLLKIKEESIITILYFIMGFLVVFLAKRGSVYDYYKLPGRLMLMAPIFQFGHFYHIKLEEKDKLSSPVYFLILILIQLGLYHYAHGSLNYSVVWVTGFSQGVLLPFLSAIIGILFWLRISGILYHFFQNHRNKFCSYLKRISYWMGNHSFSIMMHHLFAFFLLNRFFCFLFQHQCFNNFNFELFQTDIYYNCCTAVNNVFLKNGFYLLYLFIGLFISFILDKVYKILYRTIQSKLINNNTKI